MHQMQMILELATETCRYSFLTVGLVNYMFNFQCAYRKSIPINGSRYEVVVSRRKYREKEL